MPCSFLVHNGSMNFGNTSVGHGVCVLLLTSLLSGCTGDLKEQVESLRNDQQTLKARVVELEEANRHLREQVLAQGAPARIAGTHASDGIGSTRAPVLTSSSSDSNTPAEVADQLATRIVAMVQDTVEATVDERIATQVGTADDIEALFSEVVEEEVEAQEEAKREETLARRRRQSEEWDLRSLNKRAEAAGFDDTTTQALADLRSSMRESLREQLPELKAKDATIEEMMGVVALAREDYDSQVSDLLTEEQLQAYSDADWWRSRRTRRVTQLKTELGLSGEQQGQVEQAYTRMGNQIGDGFTLMGEGYVDRDVARKGARALHEEYHNNLRSILTPDQYEVYQSSPNLRHGWRR